MLNLLQEPLSRKSFSFQRLAFALSLGFSFNLKVNTLSEQLRYRKMDSDELLELYGRVLLHDIDEM